MAQPFPILDGTRPQKLSCYLRLERGLDLRFFEIYRNPEYLLLLAQGALTSTVIVIVSGAFGLFVALCLAAFRHRRTPVLNIIAVCYVEFIRNTPLIVQLFFVAFGLPMLLGYQWPFWGHSLLALTINFSAYFSEILRAGILTIDKGQHEGAASLGVSSFTTFIYIILPQTFAKMFPSLSSQFIFLFLTTGVISEIGVTDLTQAGLFIDSRTFRSFEVFLTLTAIYIALALALKFLIEMLGKRLFPWQEVSR